MIRFSVTPAFGSRGGSKVLSEMVRSGEARLKQGLDRAAIRVQNEIKLELSKGGTAPRSTQRGGRIRIIPRNPSNHLRVITNKLRSSWKTMPAAKRGNSFEARVFTNNPYSRIHEYGGPAGSRRGRFIMRARPYVRPALKTTQPKLAQDMIVAFIRPMKAA